MSKIRTKKSSVSVIKHGLPLILLCVVGYIGLTTFVSGKYDAIDTRIKKRSERAVKLEEEHKKVMNTLNINDFTLKPVPPPPPSTDDMKLK